MKQIFAALTLAALVAFSAQTASAISIQADIPVAASLTTQVAGGTATTITPDVSGAIVGINFGLLGLQYEDYTLSKSGGTFEITMFDLMLNLPVPVVNIGIGAGVGSGKSNDPLTDTTQLAQYFVQFGIPFAKVFDIHLSYRVWSGSTKIDLGGGVKVNENVDGTTTTLGLSFGF